MTLLLFGYGSLINLESASRTLKRNLSMEEVHTGILKGYRRNWTLWDDVVSDRLGKQVKGVFLNLVPSEDSFLNGVMISISDEELKYFLLREKNYNYTDITERVTFSQNFSDKDYKVVTFVGKEENLVLENAEGYYVFDRYIDIVNTGVKSFGHDFETQFNQTTQAHPFTTAAGTYTFVDKAQQKAR
jgi:cation transport regulator ChaC